MEDLLSSHVDRKVNDKILMWLNKMYGNHGEVKATRGTVHDYLGMTSDFSEKGKVEVDMIDYMATMVDDFSTKFKLDDTTPDPTAEDFFSEGTTDDLDTQQAAEYHTIILLRRDCFLASKLIHILDPQSPLCAHA